MFDESGDITIQTGDSTNQSGTILIKAGASSGSTGGHVQLVTSNVDPASNGPSGGIAIQSGTCAGNQNTGGAYIRTGNNTGTGQSGTLELYTGNADGNNSGAAYLRTGLSSNQSGLIYISTGNSSSSGGNTGDMTLITGNSTSSTSSGLSGSITLATGTSGTSDTGSVTITTGEAGGDSGAISIKTGYTPTDTKDSGAIVIATGGAEDGSGNPTDGTASDQAGSGTITIRTGNTFDQDSGDLIINTGSALDAGSDSGNVVIASGAVSTGEAGGVQISSGLATSGDSGPVIISSGSSTSGNSNAVMITTGASQTGSFGTGPIQVSTGDATGATNTGALMLSTGNTTGADVGSVFLRTGIATDPAGVNDISLSRLMVQPKETRYSAGNMAGAVSYGAVDLELEGGDVKLHSDSTPNPSTIYGGNVVIKTGQVRQSGVSGYGQEDAGNILSNPGGTQGRGEIVITSRSAPLISSSLAYPYNRFLGVNANGVLSALNIQTLGYGTVQIRGMSGQEISFIPLFFKTQTTNPQSNLGPPIEELDLDTSSAESYSTLVENYSGVDVWNGNSLQSWITNTNLSITASFTVNDNSGQVDFSHLNHQTLNVDIKTTASDPYLTLEFTHNNFYGITFTSDNVILYIHYELKHRSYS